MFKKLGICALLISLPLTACKQTTVNGPEGKALTIVKPLSTTVDRGGAAKVAIIVERKNISGPVTVEFKRLPKGVSVVDDGGKIEETERTFIIEATDKADLVRDHVATVSLRGPGGMTATEEMRISVVEKKS